MSSLEELHVVVLLLEMGGTFVGLTPLLVK